MTIVTTVLSDLHRGLRDVSDAEIEQRNRKNDL
jgi:hypothetical protein